MRNLSVPVPSRLRPLLTWAGWAAVVYVVAFMRIGFPSFWDPDEAVYAVASREMLRTGDWLAPMYNGAPFFDKPILFYWMQLASFAVFGATEFAARLVPAVSAVGVMAATWWAGRAFFSREVGRLAALIVAVLPATFALSAYAILDMTFTMFLFAGIALVASAAVHDRPARQWWGYAAIALAVLTKGPLAIVLAGIAFILTLAIAPALRARLLALRWITGVALVVAVSSPWFIYMYARFGWAFIEGYFLRENFWLYAANLYATTRSYGFYLRVAAVGFLPFTPVLIGRVIDMARGDRASDAEKLFWAWSVGTTLFFTLSRFKLDHYIYPVLPALAVIAAHTWCRLASATGIRGQRGALIGSIGVPVVFVAAGLVLIRQSRQLPLDLSNALLAAPVMMAAGGLVTLVRTWRRGWRLPEVPLYSIAGLVAAYAVILVAGLNAFERAKPMKDLASWVSLNAPDDATITAYQLDRWKTSMRFYADRHMETAETPEELLGVLSRPGTHYAVMLESELEALRQREGAPALQVVRERRGLTNTNGRGLKKKLDEWPNFVVVTNDPSPQPSQASRRRGGRTRGADVTPPGR